MGEQPWWYSHMAAAKWMNVPPWELMDRSIFWRDAALAAMSAEIKAEEELSKRNS